MKNSSKILIALGAGFAIGGILGILFAPDKGSVTRHKIAESPQLLANKIKGKLKTGKEKLDETLNRVKENMEEVV
jgi:gas vesicle protein